MDCEIARITVSKRRNEYSYKFVIEIFLKSDFIKKIEKIESTIYFFIQLHGKCREEKMKQTRTQLRPLEKVDLY